MSKEIETLINCGWTKDRPSKDGYYWYRDEDGSVFILEWDELMQFGQTTGSETMWTYAGWGKDAASGLWWPEEITFNSFERK